MAGKTKESTAKQNKAELVVIIFNVGYEQLISDTAKELEIGGGTFVNAHGLSKFEAEKFFNIAIESEKSLCLLVINGERRNEIIQAFYEKCGIGTEAQGIVFTLPVQAMSNNLNKQIFEGVKYKAPVEANVVKNIEDVKKEEK